MKPFRRQLAVFRFQLEATDLTRRQRDQLADTVLELDELVIQTAKNNSLAAWPLGIFRYLDGPRD